MTALVGVSGTFVGEPYTDVLRKVLSGIQYFSVRSKSDRDALASLTGRSDIQVHPDIAFAMPKMCDPMIADAKQEKVLGIAISPQMMSIDSGYFVENSELPPWFHHRSSNERSVYTQIAPSYIDLIKSTVRTYSKRGWKVKCIPFAVEDDLFARSALAGEPIQFVGYRPDPFQVYQEVSRCSRFIGTRFHAHVFALSAGVPLLSIAYAEKCQHLWQELTLDPSAQVDRLQIVTEPETAKQVMVQAEPVVLTPAERLGLQEAAFRGCAQGFMALRHAQALPSTGYDS